MPTHRLLILGATGPLGHQVLTQATDLGHDVTVLVRDPAKLPSTARLPKIITGDLIKRPEILSTAVANQDAVISALGVGQTLKPHALIAKAAPAIVAAMERHGVRRLIFTSAFGVGETWRDVPWLPRLFMKTLLKDIYADKAIGEVAIKTSSLDWTIVYPVGLTNGPKTSNYRASERLPLSGFPTISRADVADLLLREVDDRSHLRQGVLIAS